MVSIILPIYNVENYLTFCLESLLNQSPCTLEIICVNDGSTDNSRLIIEEYQEKCQCIVLINQENQGLSVARNTGLEYVNGKYLMFVDSDDFLEPNVLGPLYDIATKYDLDILDFRINSYKNNRKIEWRNNYLNIKSPLSGKEYFEKFIIQYGVQPSVSAWSHLYKTEFLKQNNLQFLPGRYYEDIPFTAEAYLLASKVFFIDIPIYNYRCNENSITKGVLSPKHVEDNIFISKAIVELSTKHNVSIPMDNFFNALVKQMKTFAERGRYNEILKLLVPNVYKNINYKLFNTRSRLLFWLLRINLVFKVFPVFLKLFIYSIILRNKILFLFKL
jgi:glycosyltransferase involved in cell wall biosynthesis